MIVVATGLALAARPAFAQSLLFNRGLAVGNWSTGTYWGSTFAVGDVDPKDPLNAQYPPTTSTGDQFVTPSGASNYYVSDIRVWLMDWYDPETSSGQITNDVPAFYNYFNSVSLRLGQGMGPVTTLAGVTPTVSQVTLPNGLDMFIPNDPNHYYPIWQLDFPVNTYLAGGTQYSYSILQDAKQLPNPPAKNGTSYYIAFMLTTEVGYSPSYPNDDSTGYESEYLVTNDSTNGSLFEQWSNQTTPGWGGVPNDDYAVQVLGTALHAGDANGDGKVDINDLTVVLANYGQTGMAWSQGAMDGDPAAKVDINDLTVVLANYNTAYGASSGIKSVPEPAALALLGIAALTLPVFAWRKRRTS